MGQLIHLDPHAACRSDVMDWPLIAALLVWPYLSGLTYERLVVAGFDRTGRLQQFDDSAGQADSHAGLLPALRRALAQATVASVLIAHNHPAGDAKASAMDRQATRQAAALCRLAGATLIDHWIVAGDSMVSLFGDSPESAAPAMSIDACQRQGATL